MIVSITCIFNASIASAITQGSINSITSYTPFYDPDAIACGASGSVVISASTTPNLDSDQAANAQTIIGIAKTDNLGQAGALIGLMVGLDESHLLVLANSNVPISEQSPNKQGDGSNGTSLGIFQQQITEGWSTISSSISNESAVTQLMTASYEAEAFFGVPSGSGANSALTHGLVNIQNWQSMKPWVAAQAVQKSGTPDGSNYEAFESQAQALLTKYWSGALAIPLPIAANAGASASTPGTFDDTCGGATTGCTTGATGDARILCDAERYKGIWYYYGGAHQGRAAYVAGCPNPASPPNNQASGKIAIDGTSGNPSPCATDCSGLVSMAVDDVFNQTFDWVVADITNSPDWRKDSSVSAAQPGDVVTVGTEHIEIFVSYNPNNGSVNTFGSHETGTQTGPSVGAAGYYDAAWHYIGPGSSGN